MAVALDLRLRFDLLKDARNARGDGGGRRQIGVGIGPRQAVFHPQRPCIMADNAETGCAVFIAPSQAGRRKSARRKAAVAVDGGQEHKAQIPDVFLQAPQEMAEGLAHTLLGLRIVEQGLSARILHRDVQVNGLAVRRFGPARHEGDRPALPQRQRADEVLQQHQLIGRLQPLARADAGLKEPTADFFVHLGQIDLQGFAHGRNRLIPFGLHGLIQHQIVAGMHRGGFQVAIALVPRRFRGFVEKGVFQLHPVFRVQAVRGGPVQHRFQDRTRADLGSVAGIVGQDQKVMAGLGPRDAARAGGINDQGIIVKVAGAIGDAGHFQHLISRVERQLRRCHAHAVLQDALQAGDRHHLPAQKPVGIHKGHGGKAAGCVVHIGVQVGDIRRSVSHGVPVVLGPRRQGPEVGPDLGRDRWNRLSGTPEGHW